MNKQILAMARQGTSAEDIATEFDLPIEAVRSVIENNGAMKAHRAVEVIKESLGDRITALQSAALAVLEENLASSHPIISQRACEYVLDHGLGLKEPKQNANTTNNIIVFNDQLRERINNISRQAQEINV